MEGHLPRTVSPAEQIIEKSSTFPFLPLPAEIRNEVYKTLLIDTTKPIRVPYGVLNQVQTGVCCPPAADSPRYQGFDTPVNRYFSLRLVNQQVHTEANAIFYAFNHFDFYVGSCVPSLHKNRAFGHLQGIQFWLPEYAPEFVPNLKPIAPALFEQMRDCTFHVSHITFSNTTPTADEQFEERNIYEATHSDIQTLVAQFMRQGHSLRNVTIDFQPNTARRDKNTSTMSASRQNLLEPLGMLYGVRNSVEMSVVDRRQGRIKRRLVRAMMSEVQVCRIRECDGGWEREDGDVYGEWYAWDFEEDGERRGR